MKRPLHYAVGIVLFFVAAQSWSARLGTVQVEGLQAVAQPAAGASVVGDIPQGELVTVGNTPVNGYVKVRSRAGIIGFVPESSIQITSLVPPPAVQGQPPTQAAPAGQQPRTARAGTVPRTLGQRTTKFKKIQASVFGGFAFVNAKDFYDLMSVTSSKPGTSFGVEFSFWFQKNIGILLRIEQFSKSISALGADGKVKYTAAVESMPVMLGISYRFFEDPFTVDLSGLAGMGNGTKASITAVQNAAPNETNWSASPLTFMVKTDLNYAMGKSFLIFGELGYRILSTPSFAQPSTAGNGSSDFKSGANYKAIALNLSGPFAGLGFGFRF